MPSLSQPWSQPVVQSRELIPGEYERRGDNGERVVVKVELPVEEEGDEVILRGLATPDVKDE